MESYIALDLCCYIVHTHCNDITSLIRALFGDAIPSLFPSRQPPLFVFFFTYSTFDCTSSHHHTGNHVQEQSVQIVYWPWLLRNTHTRCHSEKRTYSLFYPTVLTHFVLNFSTYIPFYLPNLTSFHCYLSHALAVLVISNITLTLTCRFSCPHCKLLSSATLKWNSTLI